MQNQEKINQKNEKWITENWNPSNLILFRKNYLYKLQDKLIKEQLRLEQWSMNHTKLYENLTNRIIAISEEINQL